MPSTDQTTHQAQARSLLNDIQGAPGHPIPRREAILDWLNAYLLRARQKGHLTDEAEISDLTALDQFLRSCAVPVAAAGAP